MRLVSLYKKLILLYPKSYRKEYGEEMVQILTDMLQDRQSRGARVATLMHAFLDLPVSIAKQNRIAIGNVYMTSTPNYVKRNSQISMLLLVPFIVLVVLNEVLPNVLPQTPAWSDVLQFLVAGLPVIAFIICAGTAYMWALARKRSGAASVWHSLRDVRHNLPMATAGILGLMMAIFIVGHDSVHCVAGNPVKEVQNLNTTLQCIRQD